MTENAPDNAEDIRFSRILLIPIIVLIAIVILGLFVKSSTAVILFYGALLFYLTVQYMEAYSIKLKEHLIRKPIFSEEVIFPLVLGLLFGISVTFLNHGFLTVKMPPNFIFLILAVLFVSVVYGLSVTAEEIYYRLLMLKYLKTRFSVVISVIIGALIFAAFHLDYFNKNFLLLFGSRFILGVGCSCLYLKYKNLLPSIIFHFIYNLTLYLARLDFLYKK